LDPLNRMPWFHSKSEGSIVSFFDNAVHRPTEPCFLVFRETPNTVRDVNALPPHMQGDDEYKDWISHLQNWGDDESPIGSDGAAFVLKYLIGSFHDFQPETLSALIIAKCKSLATYILDHENVKDDLDNIDNDALRAIIDAGLPGEDDNDFKRETTISIVSALSNPLFTKSISCLGENSLPTLLRIFRLSFNKIKEIDGLESREKVRTCVKGMSTILRLIAEIGQAEEGEEKKLAKQFVRGLKKKLGIIRNEDEDVGVEYETNMDAKKIMERIEKLNDQQVKRLIKIGETEDEDEENAFDAAEIKMLQSEKALLHELFIVAKLKISGADADSFNDANRTTRTTSFDESYKNFLEKFFEIYDESADYITRDVNLRNAFATCLNEIWTTGIIAQDSIRLLFETFRGSLHLNDEERRLSIQRISDLTKLSRQVTPFFNLIKESRKTALFKIQPQADGLITQISRWYRSPIVLTRGLINHFLSADALTQTNQFVCPADPDTGYYTMIHWVRQEHEPIGSRSGRLRGSKKKTVKEGPFKVGSREKKRSTFSALHDRDDVLPHDAELSAHGWPDVMRGGGDDDDDDDDDEVTPERIEGVRSHSKHRVGARPKPQAIQDEMAEVAYGVVGGRAAQNLRWLFKVDNEHTRSWHAKRANFMRNEEYVDKMDDPLLKMIARAYLYTRCDSMAPWLSMAEANVLVPCNFIVFRPMIEFWMDSMVLMQSGLETGVNAVGNSSAQFSRSTNDMMYHCSVSMWMAAIIHNPDNVALMRSVKTRAVIGGVDMKWFTDRNEFMQSGDMRPSLIPVMIPITEEEDDLILSMSGSIHPSDFNSSIESSLNFENLYSTADYYDHVWNFKSLLTDSSDPGSEFYRDGVRLPFVTLRGQQYGYNYSRSDWSTVKQCYGHRKPYGSMPGARAVWMGQGFFNQKPSMVFDSAAMRLG